jgi:hypothetical protein
VPSAPGSSVQVNADFSSKKGEGALLHLEEQSFSQSIGSDDYLRDYLIAHGAAIYDWVVRTRNLKRLKMEDLIFVTGHVKTSAWATWAHREISGSHAFSCTGAGVSCLGVGIQHSRSHTLTESPAHACGPTLHTRLLRASPAPSKKGKKGKQPAAIASGLQTSSRSLESAIVRPDGMELAELRQSLHMSDDVPLDQASILPNQCLLVEGFRMQQRPSLFPRRAPKGITVSGPDTSGALSDPHGPGSTELGPSASNVSSTPAIGSVSGSFAGTPSNHRSHVGNHAADEPLESDIDVVTLGESDQYAAVSINHRMCTGPSLTIYPASRWIGPSSRLHPFCGPKFTSCAPRNVLTDLCCKKEPDVQCAVAHPYDLLELFPVRSRAILYSRVPS